MWPEKISRAVSAGGAILLPTLGPGPALNGPDYIRKPSFIFLALINADLLRKAQSI